MNRVSSLREAREMQKINVPFTVIVQREKALTKLSNDLPQTRTGFFFIVCPSVNAFVKTVGSQVEEMKPRLLL